MCKQYVKSISFIKEFVTSELDKIANMDEEYQKDSIDYIIIFTGYIEDKEIRDNIISIVKDFTCSVYKRYVKLLNYCDKLEDING